MPPGYLEKLGQTLTAPNTGYLDSLKDAFMPKDSYLTTLGRHFGLSDDKAPNIFEQTQQRPTEPQVKPVSTGIEEFLPGIKAIRESIEQKSLDPFKAHLATLGKPAQTPEEIEQLAFGMGLVAPIKQFGGLKNLSTKLLEKFRGMPDEITPQQFNEVINRATKEGIRKADLDLIKEMVEKQKKSVPSKFVSEFGNKVSRSEIDSDILPVIDSLNMSGIKTIESGGIIGEGGGFNPFIRFSNEANAKRFVDSLKGKTQLDWEIDGDLVAPKENWLLSRDYGQVKEPTTELIQKAQNDFSIIEKLYSKQSISLSQLAKDIEKVLKNMVK